MLRDHMLGSPYANSQPEGMLQIYHVASSSVQSQLDCPDLCDIHEEDMISLSTLSQIHADSDLLPRSQDILHFTSHVFHNVATSQHQNVLPTLDEFDIYGLKFKINLEAHLKDKSNWFYSEQSNKVYIKVDETINMDVVYVAKSNTGELFVRCMLVFTAEVSEPVVRCKNHSHKDQACAENIKHSVLRCENSNVSYQGTIEGKNVGDRLSVRIPLGSVQPNEDNLVRQTIALKFACQNSCVGRREISIIFHLENAIGEILAKRIKAVKICSCPKRDMKKDEGITEQRSRKRLAIGDCPKGKKIMKLESDIKLEELDETKDIVLTPNGIKITMELPNWDAACHAIECALNKVVAQKTLQRNTCADAQIPALERMLKKSQHQLELEQHK